MQALAVFLSAAGRFGRARRGSLTASCRLLVLGSTDRESWIEHQTARSSRIGPPTERDPSPLTFGPAAARSGEPYRHFDWNRLTVREPASQQDADTRRRLGCISPRLETRLVRKYFGTDGVRGRANGTITPELALKIGQAAGLLFVRGAHRHRVVIGKDTRLSGYMIENALVAGFTSVGMDVLLLGPMPTPAVAMLTRSMRCDMGVMISASHNPYEDNGIKIFGPDGFKLSDETESQIEALLDSDLGTRLAKSAKLGRAKRIESVHARYIEFAKRTLPRRLDLDGLRVVVDCANGAPTRSRRKRYGSSGPRS
jgi:hypothetical protein